MRRATCTCGRRVAAVQAVARGRRHDPEAYRLYLQGRFYVLRITEADFARGVGFYRQALDRGAAFAIAWAGLSRAYHTQAGRGWRPVAEGMEQARSAARTALELDPELPEGYIALGWVLADYDWDWKGAKSELDRALALAPGDGDVHRACASLGRGVAPADRRKRVRRVVSDCRRACMAWGDQRGVCVAGGCLRRARSRVGRIGCVSAAARAARRSALARPHAEDGLCVRCEAPPPQVECRPVAGPHANARRADTLADHSA